MSTLKTKTSGIVICPTLEILIALFLFLISACKKEGPEFKDQLRMTIDGVDISATDNMEAITRGNGLTVYGRWPGGELSIEFFGWNNSAGEWQVSDDFYGPKFILFEGMTGYYAGDGGLLPQQGSGKLIIKEVNAKYIKGSFEFVTEPLVITGIVKTVANGEFHIKRSY